MANQNTVEIYENGRIFEDMIVVGTGMKTMEIREGKEKKGRFYIVECVKCKRRKEMIKKYLNKGVGTSHQACSNAVAPADLRFYRIWQAMRTRTTNEKAMGHNNGRYDNIDSECYKYFIDFYDDMWESYQRHIEVHREKDTTLDRIDPHGDYELRNLRWATRATQNQNNKRHTPCQAICPEGNIYTFTVATIFAKEHGLKPYGVQRCLKGDRLSYKGWTFKKL